MKLSEIQDLIKFVHKSGVSEVELETKDFKIIIKTPPNRKKGQPPEQTIILQKDPYGQTQVPIPANVGVTAVQQVPIANIETKEADRPVPTETIDDSKQITVKAPMIGTFYRAPAPDKPSFVNVGEIIKKGQVLCIIEAMKLFNEIESEVSGKIVKILVDDTNPVEYDQPLFLVEPS